MTKRLDTNNKIVGVKQVNKALSSQEVETVYIAKDADLNLVQDIIDSSRENGVEIVCVESMEELGNLCKIDVKAAVAALLKNSIE